MRPDTQLDYAVFQLTPTRTRCELHVAAQGLTYKLASGLLKPFVAHLGAAEEQIARGGYSIRLEPLDPGSATWFTKGTMERFVRFVSTPEVLERVSTVEMELIELEETIRVQANDALEENQTAEDQPSKMVPSPVSTGGKPVTSANLEKPAKIRESLDGAENGMEENTKQRLLRALDARRMMLQKEQGMAFARAIAAGFSIEHMGDLVLFAESFGATRLREACIKFMALCKKRQESGLWLEDLDLAAAETAQADTAFMGGGTENVLNYLRSKEYSDAWPDMQGREMKLDEFRRASFPSEGKLSMGEDGVEKLTRRGSLDELTGEFWQVASRMRSSGTMGDFNADYSPLAWSRHRQTPISGRNQLAPEEMQDVGVGYLEGNGEYRDSETGRGPGLVRGHPIMAAWQGQPQNQYMQNVHPHLPHGSRHPSLPSSFVFSRPPQPGLPYPQYLGNPYMQPPYAESNAWQMHAPVPPQYWPGNQGYNDTPRPTANEHADGVLPIPQHREAEPIQSLTKELHGMGPTPIHQPASKVLVSKDVQETVDSQKLTLSSDDQDHNNRDELSYEMDTEPPAETMRRLPRRSSSPSRRSASPMRKVQIGRSGSKRSGMVVIRNINYIARNTQDQHNRADNGTESSRSWSEDGNSDEEETVQANAEPVRVPVSVRVQDVIGLFESKKEDTNDVKTKPSKKESKRLSSKNSVLSRWTDSGALGRDTSEAEASLFVDRMRRGLSDASAHDIAEMESKQPNVIEKEPLREVKAGQLVEDMLLLPEREGASRSTDVHSIEMFAEQGQQESKKISMVDDSFIVPDSRTSLCARDSRTLDADVELASKVSGYPEQQPIDDSFIVFDRPAAREEANLGWRMSLNLESEMPSDQNLDASKNKSAQRSEIFEPDDLFMVPDRSKDTASRSWNTPVDYDMQVLAADMMDDAQHDQEKQSVVDEELPSENGVHEHEDGESGGKSKETSSKKVSEREAKAIAMQEMLERRKAAAGSRSGKPNPLAEAQSRAEKLRAYKAGLQKSKKEKEEEDKKRIEDLKNQRRERIVARSSPGGGAAAQSPSTRRAPRTPPLNASRSSPMAVPHKLSSFSPRSSINGAASSLSPNVARAKASSGNNPPRTSLGTPKASENALSRSVPSLSELRKESLKTTPSVRASTGSQRLSQLKKNLKDADSVSALKANGHTEEKKRPLPLATVRKGIPPAKDNKGESSPLVKSTKVSTVATKQQKKVANMAGGVKPSSQKRPVLETGEVAAATEHISTVNVAAVEVPVLPQETAAEVDNQEINVKNTEAEDSSPVGGDVIEQDKGHAQIRAPASSELEITGTTGDAVCLTDEANHELATSDEALKVVEESKAVASNVGSSFHADFLASSDGEQSVGGGSNAGEDYHAPIAHVSSRDDNSPTYKESDAVEKDGPHVPTELPNTALSEQCNPHYAPPSESPLLTPSKNLPQLHEAIQRAHSPEANPGASSSRKKWGDSGSQKTSKDHHAKGLKRLLLLGRKSSRSSAQNSADWVSVSMTSEVDEDGDGVRDMPSIGKNVGIGSIVNTDGFSDRASSSLPGQSHVKPSGSSSSKGSRSFFSLSTFRGKSEGKAS